VHHKLLRLSTILLALCVGVSAQSAEWVQPAQSYPHIVKRFHLYNQTGVIGPITIFTPKDSGIFRINTFMVTTVGNGQGGSLCAYVGFTSRAGPSQVSASWNCLGLQTAGLALSGAMPVPDEGGNPVTLSLTPLGDVSGATYDLIIVVERMGR